ncbi:MAG: flagellar basal body L-ring protein FlgH [Rhodobacteraceae bacterium]|nr:flagellar basal body L-ring protein FlgH [Paracoccaceae bacterium]
MTPDRPTEAPRRPSAAPLIALCLIAGCGGPEASRRAPPLSAVEGGAEFMAMASPGLPAAAPAGAASLWTGGPTGLMGDRRATARGDILTVVIEIDERAEISNSTGRSRTASETMSLPSLFGIPQRLDPLLPEGAGLADAVDASSQTRFRGQGSVSRKEKLTLRIAATVIDTLPNGVLRIAGSQEVRVNNEIRELLITGFVRPQDVNRLNEVTYDRIAGARISYGGRGQITDMQSPRAGQLLADGLLPF